MCGPPTRTPTYINTSKQPLRRPPPTPAEALGPSHPEQRSRAVTRDRDGERTLAAEMKRRLGRVQAAQ